MPVGPDKPYRLKVLAPGQVIGQATPPYKLARELHRVALQTGILRCKRNIQNQRHARLGQGVIDIDWNMQTRASAGA